MDFDQAVKFVEENKNLPTTDDEKLMIYALYKMATVGQPPDTKQINPLNLKEIKKYEAWKEFSDSKNPEKLYVKLVEKLAAKYNIRR
tara:strand:+ start:1049 stop:1309 length:261 start_codon:yes stop_codon:yes gene_type:complete